MIMMVLSTLMAVLASVLGVLAYRACSKPGVLYYQWEFSMVDMTQQFFNPIASITSPAVAQGHQEPNHVAKGRGPADKVSSA
ncbi:uncharacterized protein BDZ99DRAFT_462749 [Mytilinidion resinicola]|uniref:Uncharacterized protein n=1 Tax=Mytilinidion resinicola TaxID=574789 RepID=A0A6A6YMN7_9PEZI|nr:uncharacterized protein BDZ99DRAFT_462749 [Mytilinidion resinicola]KAF2810146.1 hypothetical protein BDZ99DRAFT_462749 [Mytilinidion resinicola]